MPKWHTFMQGKMAHPDFPWWKEVWQQKKKTHYLRDDGVETTEKGTQDDKDNALAVIDATNPQADPTPQVGQVWFRDVWSGKFRMVIETEPTVISGGNPTPWPPTGAVLVSGPQSPWEDTS